jgi:hypothetical protein
LARREDKGIRRIDDPAHFVATEIAAALEGDIRVIPVLVDGARMPTADELPDTLKQLPRRNAVKMHNEQFGLNAEFLVNKLSEVFAPQSGAVRSLVDGHRRCRRTRAGVYCRARRGKQKPRWDGEHTGAGSHL